MIQNEQKFFSINFLFDSEIAQIEALKARSMLIKTKKERSLKRITRGKSSLLLRSKV